MTDIDPFSLRPEDLEKLVRQSEESIRRLTEATGELEAITGTGSSDNGLVTARVDNSGTLEHVEVDPRAMRLASEELAENLLFAVRRAQDDVREQAERLLADALGDDAKGPVDMDSVRRHAGEINDAFAHSVKNSMAAIDRMTR